MFGLPACTGWAGQVGYPSTGGASHWLVTTSVTNNFGVPAPPSGTAIFYIETELLRPKLEWILGGSGAMVTVTSPALTASHSYTLMVYNLYTDSQCHNVPCPPLTINIGSPQPGKHSVTFSSPLNESSVYPLLVPVWQFIQNS